MTELHPVPIRAGEVELHHAALGQGPPIVFVHGGLGDYRYWEWQVEAFSTLGTAVTYSRRYSFPNDNRPYDPAYSPRSDARDLAALIEALDRGPAHVVAASIGACAALFVAAERPELVRSLIVAEPPLLFWLHAIPGGEPVWREFREDVWDRSSAAFRRGERERGVAAFIDYFLGPGRYDRLPAELRTRIMQDADDLEAQTLSTDPFPLLPREAVAALTIPVLMLSGALTRPTHALVDAELERVLAHGRRIVVPAAAHDVWVEQPFVCCDAGRAFLSGVGR